MNRGQTPFMFANVVVRHRRKALYLYGNEEVTAQPPPKTIRLRELYVYAVVFIVVVYFKIMQQVD